MAHANIELIERIYDAFGKRSYEEVMANFSEDFEWNAADSSPLADRSPYHGISEIREGVFDRIAAGFERLEVVPDEMFAAEGERVIVLGYYHGRFRGGEEDFRTQVAHIWTVSGGKAVKFQQYLDTQKVSTDAAKLAGS
ncbi:MAG: nuclear transport factor 2 family protein [Pyrinomonadaceae bacterium]